MSRVLLALIGLAFTITVSAQDIQSPQALANAVAAAIAAGKQESLAELFSPDAPGDSKKYAIQDLMAFKGATHLSAKPVEPGDKDWKGVPLTVLLKKQAEHGYAFPVEPLGRIMVSGQKAGESGISMAGAFYGKFGSNYLIMFASRKK